MPASIEHTIESAESSIQSLYNIVRTMRLARHNIVCSEDFSHLDFGNIPFNDTEWSFDGEKPCSFYGSSLNEWNFTSGHFSAIFAVAWALDGRYCLTCSNDNTAIIWDTQTGLMQNKLKGHDSRVTSGCFSRDGKRCITGSSDSSAKLWNCETGECLLTMFVNDVNFIKTSRGIRTEKSWIYAVSFSPDERFCLIGSDALILWNLQTGRKEKTFIGHLGSIISITYLEDGERCLTGSTDGTVKMLNIKTGEYLRTIDMCPVEARFSDSVTFQINQPHINAIAFSPNKKSILVGKNRKKDGYAEIWDLDSGQCIQSLRGHLGAVESVAYSYDGAYCITGSMDCSAKIWSTESGECLTTLVGHKQMIMAVSFSPDGKYCLTGSHDNTAIIWRVNAGNPVRILRSYLPHFWYGAVSPSFSRFLIGSEDGKVSLWDLETCKRILSLKKHNKWINDIAVSSDERFYLTSSMDGTVKYWSATDNSCIKTFECEKTTNGHTSWIESIVFSPDGRFFLTSSQDKTAKLWDIESGKCIKTFIGHTARIFSATFSPDGQYVITASEDKTAILWNTNTEKKIYILKGHQDMVCSVTISPSGKYALTGDWNGIAILWELRTGTIIRSFDAFSGHAINSVSFSCDEKYCFTGSPIHEAKMWSIENGICCKNIVFDRDDNGRSEWFLSYCISNFFYIHTVYRIDVTSLDNPNATYIDTLYDLNGMHIKNCNFIGISASDLVRKIIYQYGGATEKQR